MGGVFVGRAVGLSVVISTGVLVGTVRFNVGLTVGLSEGELLGLDVALVGLEDGITIFS